MGVSCPRDKYVWQCPFVGRVTCDVFKKLFVYLRHINMLPEDIVGLVRTSISVIIIYDFENSYKILLRYIEMFMITIAKVQ